MDLLEQFDRDANDFWQGWMELSAKEQRSLSGQHAYHQAFKMAFGVKQALQHHISSGPPHARLYSVNNIAEHVIDLSDSDGEAAG